MDAFKVVEMLTQGLRDYRGREFITWSPPVTDGTFICEFDITVDGVAYLVTVKAES